MFNWVCPRCGRENSPSYIECPDCKERDLQEQAAAEAEAANAPPPQPVFEQPPQTQDWQPQYQQPAQPYVQQQPPYQPQYQQPPQQPQQQVLQQPPQYAPAPQHYAPPQQYTQPQQQPYVPPQQYAQPPQYAPQQPPPYNQAPPVYVQQPPQYVPPQPSRVPPTRSTIAKPAYVPPRTPAPPEPPAPGLLARIGALPTPLLMLLFAALFLGVGAAAYYGYQRFGKGGAGFSGGEPAATAVKPKATNPIQKYIEVVGIRLTSDAKKKPIAKFIIVNHASTELDNLGANVTLWASTSRSEEDSVGSFTLHVDRIGPYESKEASSPFKTKLKIYELPDWQNATAEVQITSPQP